jgi:poly [ADP-ribose] polymerase
METKEKNALRSSKLIMVTADNNNKFYDMVENGNGFFTVTYGRVGTEGVTQSYPMQQWDSKYKEKLRKGYKDQTALFAEASQEELDLTDIKDYAVRNLFANLMKYARKSISYHYNVNVEQVSYKQIQEAQALVDNLVRQVQMQMDLQQFNQILLQLYMVIPRRMRNVKDNLVQKIDSYEDLEKIRTKVGEEQATLDIMRNQVQMNVKQLENQADKKKENLLETMGLEIQTVENIAVQQLIQKMMQDEASRFVRAYEVKNCRTNTQFDNWISKQENNTLQLFWHGSRNENWLSILESGLVLRPANAIISGKMFGEGIYFADKFRKSLNYTSLRGSYWANGKEDKAFLAIFQVHTGEQLKIKKHEDWCYKLNETNLKKQGKKYNSLFALGGADLINNEYIVYNENQCTVKYLVEVTV